MTENLCGSIWNDLLKKISDPQHGYFHTFYYYFLNVPLGKVTAGTQKLVVWVDVSPFPRGTVFRFQPLVFGGVDTLQGTGLYPAKLETGKRICFSIFETVFGLFFQIRITEDLVYKALLLA